MSTAFSQYESFHTRHIGPDTTEQQLMLEKLGLSSLEELIAETIPASIRLKQPMSGLSAKTEVEFLKDISALAAENKIFKSYIGMGYMIRLLRRSS